MDNLFDLDDFENVELHQNQNNDNNIFSNSNNEIEQNPHKNEEKEDLKIINSLEKEEEKSKQFLSKNYQEKKLVKSESNSNKSISNSNSNSSEDEKYEKSYNSDSENSEKENKSKNENISNENTSDTKLENKKYAIEDDIDIESYNSIKEKAIEYKFELDTFQKRSIIRLENHQNVLVCAHTSSGKTVIAEYGIALGKKNKKKVLYTSPIKALSNQKYRDFKIKFNDVGILTGDVSINPDAQCLIMTTEILQNSLYKNSELLNSVEWVIFDEVHYINDNERGHVWEEILILLPRGIGIIMLSATIPNYMEFAEWVGRIKETRVYVQNTLKRIVPLEYKIFLGYEDTFIVKTTNNEVFEDNIEKALSQAFCLNEIHKKKLLNNDYKKELIEKQKLFIKNIKFFDKFTKSKNKNMKVNFNNNSKNQSNNNIQITKTHLKIEEIVNYINEKKLTPVVIFVFSIKKIKEYSKMLKSNFVIEKDEVQEIRNFFDKCINTLSNEDKDIPQIQELREMLINGIGIHHSGLLPILKEIIEILYSKGLIKILFATTSFSIGLNMPTRTVVFTDIYKYNDKKKEILTSSEFLQMSGRAGRRGIDSIGYVFIMIPEIRNQENEKKEIYNMLKGSGTEIESKFRLSYRTVISFFSRNIKGIDQFFKESFLESKNKKEIPKIMKDLEDLKIECEKLKKIDCSYNNDCFDIDKYYELDKRLEKVNLSIFSHPDINILLYTEGNSEKKKQGKGRVLKVYDKDLNSEIFAVEICYYTQYNGEIWCVIYNGKSKKEISDDDNYNSMNKKGNIDGKKYTYKNYDLSDIREIYDYHISSIKEYEKLKEDDDGYRFLCKKDLKHALRYLAVFEKDSINDLENSQINYLEQGKNNPELEKAINEKNEILQIIKNSKFNNCPLKLKHLKKYNSYLKLEKLKKEKEKSLDPKNMEHYMEFNTRLKILQKLGYIDEHNIVTLKGKGAREIGTTDCVLISELLVSNILEKLSDSEIVGFISGFCSNKNEIDFTCNFKMSNKFKEAYIKFQDIFNNIENIEKNYNFEDNKYDRRITFSICKAMKSWMEGKSFSSIIKETELEEGKLYSLILRIYMFLDEIINFYDIFENKYMSEKYENIKKRLMRDIMSKESLYLQDSLAI